MAGIYVHFPFCSSRCIYCDFYARVKADRKAYLDALEREIEERKDYLKGVPPKTIYFGGGTPSVFSEERLMRVVESLRRNFDLSALEEFTVEVNPDDIDPEKVLALKSIGVTRVSMGVQSFCDNHLKWMHRRHSAGDARAAFHLLQDAGFDNISIDLIFGYDLLTEDEWDFNISEALALQPQHISCYQMMGRYASGDDEKCEREYRHLMERLSVAGFEHYEVSNYALPGFRSKHNSSYWHRDPYLGLGPGAHSFDGELSRSWNLSDIERYVIDRPYESEELVDDEVFEEEVMLSLRTSEGVSAKLLRNEKAVVEMLDEGYIVRQNDRFIVPGDKMFILDWIIARLIG